MKRRRLPLLECLMLLAGLLFVAPVALVVLNSLKSLPEITRAPLALPRELQWRNYAYIFSEVKLAGPMLNSFLMCAAVIAGLVLTAPLAAYALMRRPMFGRRAVRVFFLAGLIVPFQVVMVSLLQEMRFLGIQYTYVSLFLVYVAGGLPLCIFIYSAFLRTIPKELEEAAAIDGCGPLRTFWQIIFPLLRPCTVTIVIFWGLWIWNDFITAFVFMGTTKGELAFVQLWRVLSDKYVKNWEYIFAGTVVLSAPVTVLYLLMQRHFIKGLTAGSEK